ncbi:MAG TPA: hypothetical protein VD969_00915 [Symbiobacteriaceae bacterium]|nr:hypothetical protein [Symbiobacteriaceae bacterium]
MGKQLSRLIAGLALSVMMTACARVPMQTPGGTPAAPGGTTGTHQAPVTRGGVTGDGTTGAGTPGAGGRIGGIGGGGGGAMMGAAGTTAAGGADLGQQISYYVAGLDGIGGNAAGAAGTTGLTGAGAAPGTTAAGRSVGVSTLIVGNVAYIGIDPATMAGGNTGAGAGRVTYGPGTVQGGGGGMWTPGTVGTAGAGGGFHAFLRDRVRTRFPQVSEVFVTTEPVTVWRIARATAGGTTTVDAADVIMVIRTMTPGTTRTR